MAITSKLQVVTKDANGKELNRTVSYVNPETSDSDLTRFATAYTGLSRRTYKEFYRVNREDITNATAEPAINVTPAVTIANNAITFATPYFTPAKEQELIQKLMCNLVNTDFVAKNVMYTDITSVTSTDNNSFAIYGTLSDGTVVTADNYATIVGNYYHPSTRYSDYLCFYVAYSTQDYSDDIDYLITIALDESNLMKRMAAGTLNIANCIADLNAQLTTEFANDSLGGIPQFTYNPADGSVTLSVSFANAQTYAFHLVTDDATSQVGKGNVLLRELIGNDLFTEYYSDSGNGYIYTIHNPNYSA